MTRRIGDRPLTNLEKQRRWLERHWEEHLLARMERGPSVKLFGMGAVYCVVEWGPTVAACRRDALDRTLAGLWDRRGEMYGPLGKWLRSCDKQPEARIVAGAAALLTKKEANAVVRALAGGPPNRGGRGRRTWLRLPQPKPAVP